MPEIQKITPVAEETINGNWIVARIIQKRGPNGWEFTASIEINGDVIWEEAGLRNKKVLKDVFKAGLDEMRKLDLPKGAYACITTLKGIWACCWCRLIRQRRSLSSQAPTCMFNKERRE